MSLYFTLSLSLFLVYLIGLEVHRWKSFFLCSVWSTIRMVIELKLFLIHLKFKSFFSENSWNFGACDSKNILISRFHVKKYSRPKISLQANSLRMKKRYFWEFQFFNFNFSRIPGNQNSKFFHPFDILED